MIDPTEIEQAGPERERELIERVFEVRHPAPPRCDEAACWVRWRTYHAFRARLEADAIFNAVYMMVPDAFDYEIPRHSARLSNTTGECYEGQGRTPALALLAAIVKAGL